jgi:uncharacterized protein YjbI with pentapeptide repeats
VSASTPHSPRLATRLTDRRGAALPEDLSDSIFNGDFSGQAHEDATMERSHVTGAQFTGAILCRSRLTDMLFENCDFSGSDLDETSATRVEFRDCRMSGVMLTRSALRDVRFAGCRLDDANFRMSEAKAVAFEDADLRRSDFYASDLTGTRFFDCDLTSAEFSKATAASVRFHGSTLHDLKGGQYLAGAVIESAQVLPVALAVLAGLQIGIDDEREPPTPPSSPSRRTKGAGR